VCPDIDTATFGACQWDDDRVGAAGHVRTLPRPPSDRTTLNPGKLPAFLKPTVRAVGWPDATQRPAWFRALRSDLTVERRSLAHECTAAR
jgi:hypothetical protein